MGQKSQKTLNISKTMNDISEKSKRIMVLIEIHGLNGVNINDLEGVSVHNICLCACSIHNICLNAYSSHNTWTGTAQLCSE